MNKRKPTGDRGGGAATAEKPRQGLKFFRAFLEKPRDVGSVIPSTRRMGEAMVAGLDLASARAVVEYGPGTGSVTEVILERIGPGCRFVAIESGEEMVDGFRKRFPDADVAHDSAANVERVCADRGIAEVDCIISGLPFMLFGEDLRRQILEPTARVLREGGKFHAIGYQMGLLMPRARRFRKELRGHFSNVELSEVEWRNIPPAIVYRCTK